MQASQGWTWRSTGVIICARLFSRHGISLPHVARLIDEYSIDSLNERVLRAACEFGASQRDLDFLLLRTVPDWTRVVESAARGGHLHVFRWMAERQDSFGPWKTDFALAIDEAARYGHLELVKWLYAQGLSFIDEGAFVHAATSGHLLVLKWLHEHTTPNVASGAAEGMRLAAGRGHFATVQWIYENFKDLDTTYAMEGAARNGDLDMLQWLHQQKLCSEACNTNVMDEAVRGGHFHVVEWLHENCSKGCSHGAVSEAAQAGSVSMLQWLHKHYSDRFHSGVMDSAASEGHLEVLKWLHDHRSEGCTSCAMRKAARNGHLEVVRWLYDNRPEGCSRDAMSWAAEGGHLDVVKWLHDNRPEGCGYIGSAMYEAAHNGHVDVLRWLVEHYPDKCGNDLLSIAAWEGHLDVVQYLNENTEQLHAGWGLGAAAKQGWMKTLQVLTQNGYNPVITEWHGPVVLRKAFDTMLAQLASQHATPASLLWDEALESLEFFHRFGCYSDVSAMLERALTGGYHSLVQQYMGQRGTHEKCKYLEVAAYHGNVVLFKWLLANGTPIDTSSFMELTPTYNEVVGYLSEIDRVQLVCESVTGEWHRLLKWTLENTRFDDDSSRATIYNSITQGPSKTVQWLRENLTDAQARKWCGLTSVNG